MVLALSAFAKGGVSIAIIGTILAINDVVKSGNNSGVSPIGSGINAVTNSEKGDVAVDVISIGFSVRNIIKGSFSIDKTFEKGKELQELGKWILGRTTDAVIIGTSAGDIKNDKK